MKFCKDHWDKTRGAIALRGLDKLVAKDGATAAADLDAGRPDPLMYAHNAIVTNAVNAAGIGMMLAKDDGGEWCPICFLVENCRCGEGDACRARWESWIDLAADEAAERCGVVPPAKA